MKFPEGWLCINLSGGGGGGTLKKSVFVYVKHTWLQTFWTAYSSHAGQYCIVVAIFLDTNVYNNNYNDSQYMYTAWVHTNYNKIASVKMPSYDL